MKISITRWGCGEKLRQERRAFTDRIEIHKDQITNLEYEVEHWQTLYKMEQAARQDLERRLAEAEGRYEEMMDIRYGTRSSQ